MLPKAVLASTDLLAAAAARCAWTQWSAIGALTLHAPKADDEIVDIEALLLASLGLATRVPRLQTLATDWTLENSQLLSIARLRAMLTGPFAKSGVHIGELAHLVATEGGDARWRALDTDTPHSDGPRDGRRGAARKAMPPRWRGSRTLLLQLRRGFGVGAKPDLVAILLGSSGAWTDVSTLAELSGYSVAAVRRAADEMASAGFVESSGGHSRAFRADVTAWMALLPNIAAPLWRRRADGFAFVLQWLSDVQQPAVAQRSELDLAIRFGVMLTAFRRLWLEAGVTQQPVSDDPSAAWTSRHAAVESLVQWFGASA